MQTSSENNRLPYLASISAIVLLSIWSLITYKERMTFVDPAWVSFNIINNHTLCISEYRYGAFITQIFPLIGSYMGFSLKTILLLYSFSFYLFYLSTALINGIIFKQRWLVILQALYLTLFISDCYYWPNNEVHQGISWMFLFLGLYGYRREKISILTHIVLILLLALATSSHILVSLPLVFLWAYIHIDKSFKELIKERSFLLYSLFIILFVAGRYMLSMSGWYDPEKLRAVNALSLRDIWGAFISGQAKTFSHLLLTNYWISIAVFAISCYLLWKSKMWLKSIMVVVFTLVYFILVCTTFRDSYDRNLLFYMESEWAALSIIISTALVRGALQYKRLAIFIILILLVRLCYIGISYEYFHKRLKNLELALEGVENKQITKALIVDSREKSNEKFIMDWGLPVESILLSKLQGKDVQTSIKVVTDIPTPLPKAHALYSCFGIEPIRNLNFVYFDLDSTTPYRLFVGIDELVETEGTQEN
jgi:hypothetical protein